MRKPALNRRTLLRGIVGSAVALPWLEAMTGGSATAQQATPPTRYIVTFAGLSAGNPTSIAPDLVGPGYDVKRALTPLETWGVRDRVNVISGLLLPQDGPGGWVGRWHSSSVGPLISGVSASGDGAPGAQLSSHGDPRARGETSDQRVANAIQGDTRFHSLHYRVQPEVYRENDATFGIISYRDNAGTLEPNEPTHSPKLAYDSLFTGVMPSDPTQSAARDALLAQDLSILDLVGTRAERLLARLGMADRQRVERHFDEIRELETLLRCEGKPCWPIGQRSGQNAGHRGIPG